MFDVVLLRQSSRGLEHLEPLEFEALALKAADNFSYQSSLNTVRFHLGPPRAALTDAPTCCPHCYPHVLPPRAALTAAILEAFAEALLSCHATFRSSVQALARRDGHGLSAKSGTPPMHARPQVIRDALSPLIGSSHP